jgi:hypothetical protein
VGTLLIVFEQFVLLDHAAEGVGRNLGAGEQSLLDAQPVEQGQRRRFSAGLGPHLAEGLGHLFQRHLAALALVRAGLGLHDRDAVLLITAKPRGDGAPGEPAGQTVLVGEAHLADGLDAVADGFALGHVDGSEHAHFQINGGISHKRFG